MNVIKKSPEVYGLQKEGKVHKLVKILREYDDEHDAVKDLTRLLTGEINEDELMIEK